MENKNELMNLARNFEGNEVEIIIENGEPLFEIYSTAIALGQSREVNGKIYPRKDRIEENLKSVDIKPFVRNGQNFINEFQLYDLMLEMKTDKVRPFRKWLVSDVLPTMRKTGGYVGNDDLFINTYLPFADDATKLLFSTTLATVRSLNNKLEEQKPLVQFAETVTNSSDTIDVGQLAKLVKDEHIQIGRNRLFEWLRKKGLLRQNNEPYQRYLENGWFKVIEQTIQTAYGTKLNVKTLVTGKGQVGVIEMLKSEFGVDNK